MAHDRRAPDLELIHDRRDVPDEIAQRVILDFFGLVALAESTKIGGNDAVTTLREGVYLLAPKVPRVGPPVEQDHRFSRSGFRHVEGQATYGAR